MKQQYFKLSNIVKIFFVVGVLTCSSVAVFATETLTATAITKATPVVQYMGSENNSSDFTVQFDGASPITFDLVIKDVFGNEIYRKNAESSQSKKVYKLVNEGNDNVSDLTFVIRVANGKTYNYSVSRSVNLVKEIQVSKI